jgi:O-methyltransferase
MNAATVPSRFGDLEVHAPAVALYLNLLKRSLTNTIFAAEPDTDDKNQPRFIAGFIKHYVSGTAVSMLPLARLDNLQDCMIDVLRHGVPGDFIETGVWRGGTTIFMRGLLKAFGVKDRTVWVADSFEGLPEPDAAKYPLEAKTHHGAVMEKAYGHFAVSLQEVERNFSAYELLDDKVRFVKGWFRDTLPTLPVRQLAVLRLDGDYYESTRDALVNLYDKVSIGGYVIVDDYGEDSWTYCRQAVEDFRRTRGITEPIAAVDSKCAFWQRTR